jgi:hypothetical protein
MSNSSSFQPCGVLFAHTCAARSIVPDRAAQAPSAVGGLNPVFTQSGYHGFIKACVAMRQTRAVSMPAV